MTRRVAVLLFDNVEVMDFAGPFEVFGVSGQREGKNLFDVYTVSRESKPVMARKNAQYKSQTIASAIAPGRTSSSSPGRRYPPEKHNFSVLEFIKQQTEQAERVLSVCSGALLLAKAGLLDGLHATTHRGALHGAKRRCPYGNRSGDRESC